MKTYIGKFALLLIAVLLFNTIQAQPKKDSLRVLFVGNSYTYVGNLPQIVSLISDSLPVKLITQKTVMGGATLGEHWQGRRGLKTKEIILNGKFDIVVLQDNSMRPVDAPDSTVYFVKLFSALIKSKGAKPVLYVTWARKKVPQYQEQINSVYTKAAQENNITFIPVGPAWEEAQQIRPSVELFSPDGSHPNELGTFLTACIITSMITGQVPEKLRSGYSTTDRYGETIHLMSIDQLDVVFCLKITKKILKDFGITKL